MCFLLMVYCYSTWLLRLVYHGVYGMPISAISLYGSMDISLGIMTMVLFVRPLYILMRFKKQMGDEGMDEMNNIAARYII